MPAVDSTSKSNIFNVQLNCIQLSKQIFPSCNRKYILMEHSFFTILASWKVRVNTLQFYQKPTVFACSNVGFWSSTEISEIFLGFQIFGKRRLCCIFIFLNKIKSINYWCIYSNLNYFEVNNHLILLVIGS